MTIFTQDEVLVNYDHVTKIQTYGDVYSDDEIEDIDVAVIKAHLDTGKKVVLGFYADVDQYDEVLKDLVQWLNEKNDYKLVFRMPMPTVSISIEEDNPTETEKSKD